MLPPHVSEEAGVLKMSGVTLNRLLRIHFVLRKDAMTEKGPAIIAEELIAFEGIVGELSQVVTLSVEESTQSDVRVG